MSGNGKQPKVIGQIVITLTDNGQANMQVVGKLGPFTILSALESLTLNFKTSMAVQEQQAIISEAPVGIDISKLRGQG